MIISRNSHVLKKTRLLFDRFRFASATPMEGTQTDQHAESVQVNSRGRAFRDAPDLPDSQYATLKGSNIDQFFIIQPSRVSSLTDLWTAGVAHGY